MVYIGILRLCRVGIERKRKKRMSGGRTLGVIMWVTSETTVDRVRFLSAPGFLKIEKVLRIDVDIGVPDYLMSEIILVAMRRSS